MNVNTLVKSFSDKARSEVPAGVLDPDAWIEQYNLIFAKLIAKECSKVCGSQLDKTNILKHFDIPVESKIKFEADKPSWSIESQYEREYNLP